MRDDSLKILILSTYDGTGAAAVRDYLLSFRLHSRHHYYYAFDCRRLDARIDLRPFDVIAIFWDVYLPGPELSAAVRERIAHAPAVKVAFLQDEYRDVEGDGQAMFNKSMEKIETTCFQSVCTFVDIFQDYLDSRIKEHNDYLNEKNKQLGVDLSKFILFRG